MAYNAIAVMRCYVRLSAVVRGTARTDQNQDVSGMEEEMLHPNYIELMKVVNKDVEEGEEEEEARLLRSYTAGKVAAISEDDLNENLDADASGDEEESESEDDEEAADRDEDSDSDESLEDEDEAEN